MALGALAAGCGPSAIPAPAPPPAPSTAPPTADPRVALLEAYSMDDQPPGPADAELVELLTELREEAKAGAIEAGTSLSAALFDLFRRTHFSWPKAQYQQLYRVLNRLLKSIADPAWEKPLITMLEVPVTSTKRADAKATLDQIYWQLTACEVLGALKSEAAVPALLKVTLSPFKAPAANDAMIALIRIGDPALEAAIRLMEGKAPELTEYSFREEMRMHRDRGDLATKAPESGMQQTAASQAYLRTGVLIVANMGTKAAVEPMLRPSEDPQVEAEKAASLHLLPVDSRVERRFIEVYDRFSLTDVFPNGDYPKYLLLGTAANLFSPRVTEHLLTTAFDQEGSPEDRQASYAAILEATVPLATKAQWPTVDKLLAGIPSGKATGKRYTLRQASEVRTMTDREIITAIEDFSLHEGMVREVGSEEEFVPIGSIVAFRQSLFKAEYGFAVDVGGQLLDACGDDVSCYLRLLTDPKATRAEPVARKAAGMVGLLGDASVKPQLVDVIAATDDRTVHGEVAMLLLHFSPNGDPAIAARLRNMLTAAEEASDKERIDRMKPFKQVIYRLEARSDG